MNAAVALCHFCEAHGPRVVVRTKADEEDGDVSETAPPPPTCGGCAPEGAERHRKLSSGRLSTTAETDALLAHAALRSLSCEVSSRNENALVFFGDSRGYVLSYAFQIKDTQARGLKRCFSFIVFMKDKLFLLNITPFLSKQLEETARELQNLANVVYAKDQAVCSQRALRLLNNKTESVAPRSLVDLTGKKNIFPYLHTKFSWMLSSCGKVFAEIVCDGLSPLSEIMHPNHCSRLQSKMSLYSLKEYFGNDDFFNMIYCVLTGIQVVIRGDSEDCGEIAYALTVLLPKPPETIEYTDYVPSSEARILFCKSGVAVPKPCAGIFRVDIVDEKPLIHWLGVPPPKWPTIMINILKGVDNKFKESTLLYHIDAMREKWINNATVIKCSMEAAASEESIIKLKSIMGIKAEDEDLLQYWLLQVQ